MTCTAIRYLLPDYVNGKCILQDQAVIEYHLTTCRDCSIDAEALSVLLFEMKSLQKSSPSSPYWGSILPRVHERMEMESSQKIPDWMIRFAPPVTAAVLLIIAFIVGTPFNMNDSSSELRSILSQLQPEEMQQVTQSEALSEIVATPTREHEQFTDKEIVKQLIEPETALEDYAELDSPEALNSLTDHDAEGIVIILRDKPLLN